MSGEHEKPPGDRSKIVARVRLIDALRAFGFDEHGTPTSGRGDGSDPDLEDTQSGLQPPPPRS
jgi:hypothetical protein